MRRLSEPGCDSSNGWEQKQHSYMPARVPQEADRRRWHPVAGLPVQPSRPTEPVFGGRVNSVGGDMDYHRNAHDREH